MRVLPVAAITPPVCSGQGEIALKNAIWIEVIEVK